MNECIIGNIVGVSQVIIGFPFDTIKTNMQISNTIDMKCFILNPRTLYSGIAFPLFINGISTSFVFGTYDYFTKKYNNRLYAGVLTGILNSIILTPFDYFKIHRQQQSHQHFKQTINIFNSINSINTVNKVKNVNKVNNFNNVDTVNKIKIIKTKQDILQTYKNSFSGFSYTLAREVISIPIYFFSYYYLIENTQFNSFFAGGIAGVNSWLFTYPIDTLKTRAQLYNNKSFRDMINMGFLYKGLTITLIRAFIVNSFSFYIYDFVKKHYNYNQYDN